jgi:hypothetical protein
VCLTCNTGYYLLSNYLCQLCNISNCYSCFSNGSCNTCAANFTLNNGQCIQVNIIINNCLLYSSLTSCSNCTLSYFLFQNECFPCSILCLTCFGPHFGDCITCIDNSRIYNKICLPYYTINKSLQYQVYLTARNNLKIFNPSNLVEVCSDVVVISAGSITL